MTHLMLLAAATVPNTPAWSPKVAVVMIICNILAIAIGKAAIQQPHEGPELDAPGLGGFSVPALIASTSFGHILGVGSILGLAYLGAL